MIFMAVDLPDRGPMMAANSPLNFQIDTGERVNGRLAAAVDFGGAPRLR